MPRIARPKIRQMDFSTLATLAKLALKLATLGKLVEMTAAGRARRKHRRTQRRATPGHPAVKLAAKLVVKPRKMVAKAKRRKAHGKPRPRPRPSLRNVPTESQTA